MMPLCSALLLWVHFVPRKALKRTLRIPFKSPGSGACDLKPNQRGISAWRNCNIMRVDKTLLFNTMIFTCHLSLSLRSVNRIDSISGTAQNTNWKKKEITHSVANTIHTDSSKHLNSTMHTRTCTLARLLNGDLRIGVFWRCLCAWDLHCEFGCELCLRKRQMCAQPPRQ